MLEKQAKKQRFIVAVISMIVLCGFYISAHAGDIEKVISYRHGVSENGNLQAFRVVKIMKGNEVVYEEKGPPYTPVDVKNMEGFDDRSKEIVAAITTPEVKAEFAAEKQRPTGVGIEEIVTYDRTVDNLSRIAVRRITRIFDNGKEISKRYHRTWIMPGNDYGKADAISKALAIKLHTPEVIAAYKAKIKKLMEIE